MNITQIISFLFFFFLTMALILNPEMGEKRDWALYYACFLSILVSYGVVLFWRFKKSVTPVQERLSPFAISKWDSFAFVFLALNSLRPYDLGDILFHHHSFYVGPAELLHQGFIPLREIPSQYGFLTYVLTAAMPFGSAWDNFLILNRVFVFLNSLIVYSLMRMLFPCPRKIPVLIGLTFLSVFVWVGWVPALGGPLTYPSVSGFRFLPSFLLIFIALIITKYSELNPAAIRTIKFLNFTGFFLWGLSSLWSIESFLYATGAWASFQISWVILQGLRQPFSWPIILTIYFKFCVSFFLSAGLVWGTFLVAYSHIYGLYPDLTGLWEYALVYQSGFFALPIEALSPSWIFLLLFITGTVFGTSLLERRSTLFPLVTATLGWLYVCTSYYISRSHPNNFCNLMPQVVVSLSVFYLAAQKLSGPNSKKRLFSRILILGGALLILPLIRIKYLSRLVVDWGAPQILPTASDVPSTNFLKQMAKELEHVLNGLKIEKHEPWILLDRFLETSPVSSLQSNRWVPIAPAAAFAVIPPERQKVYLERVALRNHGGGWVVYNVSNEDMFKELSILLPENFQKVKERSFYSWRADYFQSTDLSNKLGL